MLQATHPPPTNPLTFKPEGGVPQQNSKSKNILEWSLALVHLSSWTARSNCPDDRLLPRAPEAPGPGPLRLAADLLLLGAGAGHAALVPLRLLQGQLLHLISHRITVLQIIQEYERAVIFRLGRIKACGSQSPGLHFILPCIDKLTAIDLRTQVFDVVPQEVKPCNVYHHLSVIMKVLTKDSVTVSVDAVVYYRVSNATVSPRSLDNMNI